MREIYEFFSTFESHFCPPGFRSVSETLKGTVVNNENGGGLGMWQIVLKGLDHDDDDRGFFEI
jgi:hypothetical protein